MTFSLEKEQNDLETLIFLALYYKAKNIDHIIAFKNLIIDNLYNMLSLEETQQIVLSKNINYVIIKNFDEWKRLIIILGLKLLEENKDEFINNLKYINNNFSNSKVKLPFEYVQIDEIFDANVNNMILPLVWKYDYEYKYIKLYVVYSDICLFHNFDIIYVPKVKNYSKIIKYNYSWIGMNN